MLNAFLLALAINFIAIAITQDTFGWGIVGGFCVALYQFRMDRNRE